MPFQSFRLGDFIIAQASGSGYLVGFTFDFFVVAVVTMQDDYRAIISRIISNLSRGQGERGVHKKVDCCG